MQFHGDAYLDHQQYEGEFKSVNHKVSNLDHISRDHTTRVEKLEKTMEDFRKIFGEKCDLTHAKALANRVEGLEKRAQPASRLYVDTINSEREITCDALRGMTHIVVNGVGYTCDIDRDDDYVDEDDERQAFEIQQLKELCSRAFAAMNDKAIRDAVYNGTNARYCPSAAARACFASVLSDLADLDTET